MGSSMAAPSCSWRAMLVRRSISLSARVSPACTHMQQHVEHLHSTTQCSGLSPYVKGLRFFKWRTSQHYLLLQLAIVHPQVASPHMLRKSHRVAAFWAFPVVKMVISAQCGTGLLDGSIDPSV